MSDRLNANEQITVYSGPNSDQILTSQNAGAPYTLILQADANYTGLTIWQGPQPHSGDPIWRTPLFPPGSQVLKAVMEPHGDFVVYDTNNIPLWRSDTAGHDGAYVVIENRGLLVVYDATDLPLWASDSKNKDGIIWASQLGTQQVTPQGAGLMGVSHNRYGVFGHSKISDAIHGQTDSDTRAGVWGECSGNGEGVHGESSGTGAAVVGISRNSGPAGLFNGDVKITGNTTLSAFNFSQPSTGHVSSSAFALTVTNDQNGAISAKGSVAGHFEGDIEVTGDIKLVNADCV